MSPTDEHYREHGLPSPEDLHSMLDEIPDTPEISIDDYASVIRRLHHEKGYSFKQITAFLNKQGLKVNRSAVYRCYKDAVQEENHPSEPLVDEDTGEVVEP